MSMDRFDRAVVEKWGDAWPFAVEVAAMIRSFVSSCGDCHHTTDAPELRDEIAGLKAELAKEPWTIISERNAEILGLKAKLAEAQREIFRLKSMEAGILNPPECEHKSRADALAAELASVEIRYAKAGGQVDGLRAQNEKLAQENESLRGKIRRQEAAVNGCKDCQNLSDLRAFAACPDRRMP